MIPSVKADGKAELELLSEIESRSEKTNKDVTAAVSEILANVKARGDEAVREYTIKFDGKAPEKTEISKEEMQELAKSCDPDFLKAVERAAENIADFQQPRAFRGALPQIERQASECFRLHRQRNGCYRQGIPQTAKMEEYAYRVRTRPCGRLQGKSERSRP